MSRTKGTATDVKRILGAAAAAGMAFALGFGAVPAFAVASESEETESTTSAGSGASAAGPGRGDGSKAEDSEVGPSAAGLDEAVLRDLGMTPEKFKAAGELGKRAAETVAALRGVPGYLGVRLQDAKIIVTGSGPELGAAAAKLAGAIPGLEIEPAVPPAAGPEQPPAAPATSALPGAPEQGSGGVKLAFTTEQLFQDYLREVGPEGLQAVVTSGGKFVIRSGGVNSPEFAPEAATGTSTGTAGATDNAKISASEFVAKYANVSLDDGAGLAPEADLPGGLGYRADNWVCSTGFSAFDPSGLTAVLTAGHCANDGAAGAAILEFQGTPAGLLGQFGFSQFGGPGNSPVLRPGNLEDPGNVGTDIAVIGDLREDLDPLPAASTWGAPTAPDVKIIGTSAPVVGMPVCRSGRSSGWSCGHIAEVGIFVAGGAGHATDPGDLRAFNGFLSFDVQSSGGDSGGPWLSGNYAVGTHTAGETPDGNGNVVENFAVAATLEDALKVLPGYQLELFLNKPELVGPADSTFAAGTSITGRVPAAPATAIAANSKVRITVAGHQPLEVPVNGAGEWSFMAPLPAGPLTFTAEAVNGFSRSGAVSLTAIVAPSPLAAPAITTPATHPLTELRSLEGSGAPGATVMLSGEVAGSGTVGLDGQWSVSLTGPAAYGSVGTSAVLSSTGLADSPVASATFIVIPPAPVFAIIADGQHFRQDELPETITGSGAGGAEVAVVIDGLRVATAGVLGDGSWSVPFPDELGLGTHTVSVMQAVDGVASAPAAASFSIGVPVPAAAPVPTPTPAAVPASLGALSPAGDAAVVVRPQLDNLARTGASGLLLAAGLAALALVAGGVLLALARKRKRAAQNHR
ncbi:hypothetical protein [Pseudarthrobacter sp. DSP2-3-2b1]|uniref:S1 family peptidase n=1 Tax=Pseudarthrobacter sp. DSP2-3-2b1 TaxID=2804661 RepID=UPI003CE993E1